MFKHRKKTTLLTLGNVALFVSALIGESYLIGNEAGLVAFMTGGTQSEMPSRANVVLDGPDIIFFGSSYTWAGINPYLVEKETGMSAINISLLGANFGFVRGSFYYALSRRVGVRFAVVEIITSEQFKTKKKALSVSPDEIDDLLSMASWGKSMGVKTIFYFPPSGRSPDSVAGIDVLDFDDPRRYPELFDPAVRKDEAHLNRKGAHILSLLISHEIKSDSEPSS